MRFPTYPNSPCKVCLIQPVCIKDSCKVKDPCKNLWNYEQEYNKIKSIRLDTMIAWLGISAIIFSKITIISRLLPNKQYIGIVCNLIALSMLVLIIYYPRRK